MNDERRTQNDERRTDENVERRTENAERVFEREIVALSEGLRPFAEQAARHCAARQKNSDEKE